MALPNDPNFIMTFKVSGHTKTEKDQEHDESDSAARVAVDLISCARLAFELDSVYTDFSAQYLVDNAGSRGVNLTVKDCLEFALKKGIPKKEDWTDLGSVSKPPSSLKPALVYMKGQVVEPKNIDEARELFKHQPVGAKLHVFSPHIVLQLNAIYCGPSGEEACYVGLRDGIIVGFEEIEGTSVATVKVWYKKMFMFVKVALDRVFSGPNIELTRLLVDFCAPRLSIN